MDNIETTGAVAEATADQQSAFLQGWEDETPYVEESADQQDNETEGAQEEPTDGSEGASTEEEPSEQTESETTDASDQDTATEQSQPETGKRWPVKYMGAEKSLGVEDITSELLQKGLDYDRVRSKYDEARPVIDLFAQYAKQANMSLTDYAKHIRQEAKKASGMSAEEAARTIELEDREAAVSAQEAARQESQKSEDARKAKVEADLAEFKQAFPEVYAQARSNPKAIPQSVWDEVNSGKFSLTSAYSRYAVAQAKQEAETAMREQQTAAQNQRNSQRSTGSQKSAGSDTKPSAFLEGFDGG